MTPPQIHFERSGQASLDEATAQLFPYVFLPAYLRFLEEYAGWRTYYAISSDGARLPLLVKTIRGFRLGQLLSPPLHAERALSVEEERVFVEGLILALRHERICHRLMQPTTNCVFQAVPTTSRACRFGSFRLRLEGRDDDDLLAGMDSGHRYEIRSAQKKGAEVATGRDQIRTFFDIHAATMKDAGLSHDRWEFDHTRIAESGPVEQIVDGRHYLQVVHDRNVSNSIRGRPREVAARSLLQGFPISVLDVSQSAIRRMWWSGLETISEARKTVRRVLSRK